MPLQRALPDARRRSHVCRPSPRPGLRVQRLGHPVARRPRLPARRRQGIHEPWLTSFITCAAPYAPRVGQPRSGDLLERRIHRVLAIAHAHAYDTLVLGAWGSGAFANDPGRTARDFRTALETAFAGAFREVVFAIADWSPDRRFLGPFREAFSG